MSATYWWRILAGLAFAFLAATMFWTTTAPRSPPSKQQPLAPLPALGADISNVTVSGISSGAYMAGQFQLAHASMVSGAALIAGGPYGCAQSVFSSAVPGAGAVILSASRAINGCMRNALTLWGVPNPARLARKARLLAQQNKIDPISDVASDRLYLFSGTRDQTVKPAIVEAANQFYLDLGIAPQNILFKSDIAAGHGFVTESEGGECSRSAQPFIIDCDYDQAGALLNHLYGGLQAPAQNPGGTFVQFDQLEYSPKGSAHGLARTGVAYVPQNCTREPGCRVHIAFHGCSQNRAAVGSAFIKKTGFARWADTNRIIILFPQAAAGTLNPTACWDWWGYTGNDYLTRAALQISAVRTMLDGLKTPIPQPQSGS